MSIKCHHPSSDLLLNMLYEPVVQIQISILCSRVLPFTLMFKFKCFTQLILYRQPNTYQNISLEDNFEVLPCPVVHLLRPVAIWFIPSWLIYNIRVEHATGPPLSATRFRGFKHHLHNKASFHHLTA